MNAQELVRREVYCCASTLVSTLAGGASDADDSADGTTLAGLAYQAAALAAPIIDWEEPLVEAGWTHDANGWHPPEDLGEEGERDAYRACEEADLDPYAREVFEHWIVSDWLADKLEAKGEKVDRDFAGLVVWARTTTGQAIYADALFEDIAREVSP